MLSDIRNSLVNVARTVLSIIYPNTPSCIFSPAHFSASTSRITTSIKLSRNSPEEINPRTNILQLMQLAADFLAFVIMGERFRLTLDRMLLRAGT